MSKFLDIDGLEYYTQQFKPYLVESVNNGIKNLLDCSLETLKSLNPYSATYQFTWSNNVATSGFGVTFTINTDSSISVSANSSTKDVWFKLSNNFIYSANTDYILSGCPQGGSTSSYFIESDSLNIRDTGNSATIVCTSEYTDNIFICVKASSTFDNYTFYPMLCTKAAWTISHTYQPYNKMIASQSEILDVFRQS